MNQFRICNKCKGTNINTLVPKLKKIDANAEIIIGCQNFCGIGARKSFVIFNHVPVIADSEDELIKLLKSKLN